MTDIVEKRLFTLSKYYHEGIYLIQELGFALENIENVDDLESAKLIAIKALALIAERRDKYYPNLYPNGEFHTGHIYPEYLSLPRKTKTEINNFVRRS